MPIASFGSTLGWIAAAVVGLVVAYLLFMVLGTICTNIRGAAPKGVEVTAEAPGACDVGEVFEVVVRVRETLGRTRALRSVDVDESYLAGIAVEAVDPAPVQTGTALGVLIHTMKETIPASGAVEVRLKCRARRAGEFAGEVAVYVDSGAFRYIDCPVRTVVS